MDRVTKATLVLIAAGLWANAAVMTVQPARAQLEERWLGIIAGDLAKMRIDFHQLVAGGIDCTNVKLCR